MNQFSPVKAIEPHNIEAEQQVLGAVLLRNGTFDAVKAAGGDGLFFDPVHSAIYSLIEDRLGRGMMVSPVSLSDWAKSHKGLVELGGAEYLARLAGSAVATSFVSDYCGILADLTAKRGLIQAIDAVRDDVSEGSTPSDAIIAKLDQSISKLNIKGQSKTVSMLRAVTVAMEQAVAAQAGDHGGLVQTGIKSLDEYLGGFRAGQLILLGGRPSMGKTSVALNVALNAARAGHPVIICSLEMNPEDLAIRAISEQTAQNHKAVAYRNIIGGDIPDWQMENVAEAAREIAELPIEFLTREFSDIGSMKAGVVQAQKALGAKAGLLVIDYAQLLKTPAKSRYEQITEISIELKALSGKMGFPILALSQLSRALEQRDDKRPMLSDLRESGQLEQDADTVLFCYRDEYYLERDKPEDGEVDAQEAWSDAMNRSKNKLEIIVAKQRQGAIGTANVMCNVALNRIWERT